MKNDDEKHGNGNTVSLFAASSSQLPSFADIASSVAVPSIPSSSRILTGSANHNQNNFLPRKYSPQKTAVRFFTETLSPRENDDNFAENMDEIDTSNSPVNETQMSSSLSVRKRNHLSNDDNGDDLLGQSKNFFSETNDGASLIIVLFLCIFL